MPDTERKPVHKMEGWNKFCEAPQVKACDMVLELEVDAKDHICMTIDKYQNSKDYETVATVIKNYMDKKYGKPWHCVVGEGFGFEIVHQARTLLQLYHKGIVCVLYKC